jgi:glutathione synthase
MDIARFSEFTVPTLVTRNPALLSGFIDQYKDVILKPLDGMGGASVFRVRVDDPNRNVIIETLAHYGARTVAQSHPRDRRWRQANRSDRRSADLHALARIPKLGETRGNLAAGGLGPRVLTARSGIAESIGPQRRPVRGGADV